METSGPIRWGICCAGKICSDFCAALKILAETEHKIVAVAARNLERAQEFATKFDISAVYGTYEELAKDENIDIVYIGSIHSYHYSLSKLFLNAGKNILCEKPLALNSKHVTEIIELAKQKNVFFMEGFWSKFFPLYNMMNIAIDNDGIGEVQMVCLEFGFEEMASIPNLTNKDMGGGALMAVGCYTVMFANMIFNNENPGKIYANGQLTSQGVDGTTNIVLEYSNGRMARLLTSVTCDLEQKAVIFGTKGKIVVNKFWNAVDMEVNGKKVKAEDLPKSEYAMNFPNSEGLIYEARCVRECLMKGLQECPLMPLSESLSIMNIMDEARRQMGVRYPADDE